ncbi:prevent-host-death family protein [Dyella sp. OK004]|uniref:type II toxin-antitoxin system Phd/YefM family antitoxin n=1 Tax=Dyella sp. OK004 TaxID=1855292 RepID=UPI0008E48A72|nr:type II toxin-antitoxin system Phd/YefM family antitoxin [Dyella sp. OK004]SFR94918.1 prevent-host-death family protein [Dyella sp. OK004]
MRTINFSDARGNLKEVLDNVASDHAITLIKRRDAEDAVVMSVSDYNSIQETLYLFGNPANAERLHTAMAEAEASLPAGARILGPKGNASMPTVKTAKKNGPRKVMMVQESKSRVDSYKVPRPPKKATAKPRGKKGA